MLKIRKYMILLNRSVDKNIRDELLKINIHIEYEAMLLSTMIYVETEVEMEQIKNLEFVECVKIPRFGKRY